MRHILLTSQLSQLIQEYVKFIPYEETKFHIHPCCATLCLLGLQIGEPSVAEALERAISNHCTKVLHVPHKSGQVRHLQSLSATCISERRKNHLKRNRFVLLFIFLVGIYMEDSLAEMLMRKQNRDLTFLILNVYPQSGRTSQSHGSPSICGGWIGWSGEGNNLMPASKK